MIKKLLIIILALSMILVTIQVASALSISPHVEVTSSKATNLSIGETTNFDELTINSTGIYMEGMSLTKTAYDYTTGIKAIREKITYFLKEKFNYNSSHFHTHLKWETPAGDYLNDVTFNDITADGEELRIYTLTIDEGRYNWETSELPAQYLTQEYSFYLNHTNLTNYVFPLSANYVSFTWYQGLLPLNVTSELIDTSNNMLRRWNNTALFNYTIGLGDGLLKIYFGFENDVYNNNYTQQYQFIKGADTLLNENLTILRNTESTTQVQVYDRDANVKNAKVRVWCNDPLNKTDQFHLELIGQYITNSEGKTDWIALDKDAICYFEVSKEGFATPQPVPWLVQEIDLDTVRIELTTPVREDIGLATIAVAKYFQNRSLTIYGQINPVNAESVKIQTNFRNLSNNQSQSLTETSLKGIINNGQWLFMLRPSEHFSSSGTDNITLHVWIDDIYVNNITIQYLPPTQYTDVLPQTSLKDEIAKEALIVFIIFSTLMTGFIFRSQNAGAIGFTASTIVAGIINPILFFLLMVIIIRFVASYIRKMRSDE